MTDQQRFQEKQWSQIVARAWADEAFKARLLSQPQAVLREHGLEMAPGIEVRIVEDAREVRHFVLPANPVGELTEEELSPTAGADSFSGFSRGCGGCGRCGCGCAPSNNY
ncbi:MAG: NHLP leader peptide family RiPP precursor [Gemmataceae bacterium]